MRQPDIVSEKRLKALREEAARTCEVKGGGVVPSGAPFPRRNTPGYYGIPLLKEPVWTWQVLLYFFVGGAAGACAVIGFFAHVFENDPALARAALRIALGGGLALSIAIGNRFGASFTIRVYAPCFQAALPDVRLNLDVGTFLNGD
jgi:hypothetical protein